MSGKYLGPTERAKISEAWRGYASVREIAGLLGVAPKTVYEELKRGNADGALDHNQRPAYDPELAQRRFQANLRRRGHPRAAEQ